MRVADCGVLHRPLQPHYRLPFLKAFHDSPGWWPRISGGSLGLGKRDLGKARDVTGRTLGKRGAAWCNFRLHKLCFHHDAFSFCCVKIHVLTASWKELLERSINLTAGECALASQVVSSVGKQDAKKIKNKVILAPSFLLLPLQGNYEQDVF